MDATIRRLVRDRAGHRCEYCRLPQHATEVVFHIEHIVARQHRGGDDLSNLCLACDRCNLHKGPNLTAIDPVSGTIVALFHPRRDDWDMHFDAVGDQILGRTEIGRAIVELLQMNSTRRRALRMRLLIDGIT